MATKKKRPKATGSRRIARPRGAPEPTSKKNGTSALSRDRIPVVGIGASAGGLEALQAFFDAMPSDSGMAFVVVTHQHPGHLSLLPELLGRHSTMPVGPTEAGAVLLPNRIYVSPPGKNVELQNGRFQLTDLVRDRELQLPIDFFLRSLARERKEHAICVVLSGTGTDGTLGLRAIKGEFGMAMVQDEPSARFAGMPQSAAATQLADYVLAPSQMPPRLVAYVRGPKNAGATERAADDDLEGALRHVFAMLHRRTGQDFGGYKINTVRRRVERRMRVHQVEKPSEYVRILQSNPHELDLLFKELLISVTSFFRDAEAFDALKSAIAARLASHPTRDGALRIWVPGCATGEEAYSIGIALAELAEESNTKVNGLIFGTDLDAHAIDYARAGLYPQGMAVDVGPKRLARFFLPEDTRYRIKKEIREMMVFATQNVIKDPPFTQLDLISCRNVLIYLNQEIQQRLMPLFHYALLPGGLLMLGTSETVGNFTDLFTPIDRKWKLYERSRTRARPIPMTAVPPPHRASTGASSNLHLGAPAFSLPARLDKVLLERFVPPTVIVNAQGEVIYIHGRTGAYLEPTPGEPRNNLFTMAREGLRIELPSAVRKASTEDGEVVRKGVVVGTRTGTVVDVRIQRIDDPEPLRGLFRVTFEAAAAPQKGARPIPKRPGRAGLDLERELAQTRDTLQGTIEALQTSNEELKSSNEELQSTNEELQSTNEEIETSKEELQSVNEELQTVNAELQTKVDEVARANDDMQNLLNSTQIATLFLDRDLRIKRFTDQTREVVRLIPGDIGRPIGDLVSHLRYADLTGDARRVLETLVPHEIEIQTIEGSWRLLRMLPYRTSQNVIDGVVVTLVDIDRLTKAEHLASSRAFAESIVQTVREPLLVLDGDLRVLSANRAFFRTFRLEPEVVEGHSLFEIGRGLMDVPNLRERLQEIVQRGGTFQDFELEHDFAELGHRRIVMNARRLEGEATAGGRILLALSDVTSAPH